MPYRNRLIRGTFFLVAALSGPSPAAEPPKDAPKPKAYSDPRELQLSPQPAPVPALKYRLLPLESERTPGDAAPIYNRLAIRATTEGLKEIEQKCTAWADLPLGRFPVGEARTYLEKWAGSLEQLKFGARRRACDWNYTLIEQRERVIEVVLSDAQEMRRWTRLLALKARVEVAEHKFEDAVRSFETGISFGRHIGEGPFIINALIGVATAQFMLGGIEELIAQPDAPNLYWALTALPRPLVEIRKAIETEEVMPEWMFPELKEAGRTHADAEWSLLMARLHARMREVEKQVMVTDDKGTHPATTSFPDLATYKAGALPAAKAYAADRKIVTDAMTDDHLILTYLAGRYREIYDDQFKNAYLPFPDAFARSELAEKQRQAVKVGDFDPFVTLIPGIFPFLSGEARLERKVAALRLIEAIRMHAADRGELPRSLDQVTIVPIPLDPMTGKSFEYKLDGDTATLVSPEPEPKLVLTYKLKLRK